MSREMRTVAPGWEHPRDDDGRYIPLHDESYREAVAKQAAFWSAWAASGEGLEDSDREACEAGEDASEYAPYIGTPDSYRPDWKDEERTRFAHYETVTEGTPVSPTFDTIEALAYWLVEKNGGTFDRWLSNLKRGGWCPSGIGIPGAGVLTGEEAVARGLLGEGSQ